MPKQGDDESAPKTPGNAPGGATPRDAESQFGDQAIAVSQATKLQTRLAWIDFLQQQRNAHLVSAVVVPSPTAGHLRRLHNMMNRLIEQQDPVSAFATAIVRENNIVLIHCGFADQQDADMLARQTHARRADIPSGWSSHRSFRLSAEKEVTLAGLLAPPRVR